MCNCGKLGTKPTWFLAMLFSLEVSLNTDQLQMPCFWAGGAHQDAPHSTEWGTLSARVPLVGAFLAGLSVSSDWATGESAVWGPRLSLFPAFFSKGRLHGRPHPYFPHYYALGSLLHFNTNLPEHFFCWQWEKKQNSEQNAFQTLGPSLTPQTQGALFGIGVLPNLQGTCFVPVSHSLLQTQALHWAISPATNIARETPLSKFDFYQVKSKLPSWQYCLRSS